MVESIADTLDASLALCRTGLRLAEERPSRNRSDRTVDNAPL